MTEQDMTNLQRAWLEHYLTNLNASASARLAGYNCSNEGSYRVIGHENLANPMIRAEIKRRLAELLPSPEETLQRLSDIAFANPGEYIGEDGLLDVQALVNDGKGYLLRGMRPVRGGIAYDMVDQLGALKLYGRYHKLFSDQVDVHIETQEPVTKDALDGLVAQVVALEAQAAAEQ